MKTLNEILNANITTPDLYKSLVPPHVYNNLKDRFAPRPYQQEAFGRFVYYWNEYRPKNKPTQLLFHMATGSGKTLIMAGLIIYLYEQGYRNFLFFVNSNNIIDKTRDNFFNTQSSKYLFANSISIGDKQVKIKEVSNFQGANQNDINIVFSTIQGLHTRLNTPKENSITYDDFEDRKIVLISDEAHHINAETKKANELAAEEREEIKSWEGTVNQVFAANKDNVLLEFTATADLSVPNIADKYHDKLIFNYPLRQFRKDGYSKEVKVLQADLPPFDRALQGVLLSQYRRKLFERHKKGIKPVILFKSKTIKESNLFFEVFTTGINSLNATDLQRIKDANTDNTIGKVFSYLQEKGITLENLVSELKEDFSSDKLISVNSKDESEQKQLAVNSLEDDDNEYRAVFAVDKLNEGWDVLNLFDIVRLYDSRDASKGKAGKTTMAEAQLIGRGARYCPFKVTDRQPLFGRKYDDDLANELRICEELYYHSAYNPRYIQELYTALVAIGIKAAENERTSGQRKGLLSRNNNGPTPSIADKFKWQLEKTHKVALQTGHTHQTDAFDTTTINDTLITIEKQYKLIDFGETILRKALGRIAFYHFNNLKTLFPQLDSITEFITSENYLGNVHLIIKGTAIQLQTLSPKEKLTTTIKVLDGISQFL